ncbi:MAG: ligase-associated DNA damage response exonuclease [Chitinophagales bacterium]|nr:ligase-associated DNA damage response exonuclease [Chitinophagales bacterium]
MSQLLKFTQKGIFCEEGNFYIDPWRPVDFAIITHAHSDHARYGCKHYLAHKDSKPVLRLRLGENISLQTLDYGDTIYINGVSVSLYPSGHIIGAAQIKVEYKGEIWVVAGDYKLQNDGICTPFEPVKCHTFITESTFALPVYRWKPQKQIFDEIHMWWRQNASKGKVSILCGYALGKAQRLSKYLNPELGKIFLHGAVANVNAALINSGIDIPDYPKSSSTISKNEYRGSIIIAPPSVAGTPWLKKFEPYSLAICSGWMQIRGNQRRRNADVGFVLSDHADWNALLSAIEATGAEHVIATHGYTEIIARYLRERGLHAEVAYTEFGSEESDFSDYEELLPSNIDKAQTSD